jgi:hypothetical protein
LFYSRETLKKLAHKTQRNNTLFRKELPPNKKN